MNDISLPFPVIHHRRGPETPKQRPLRRASRLLSLEQRFMFDGAAVATAADAAHAAEAQHAAALAAEAAAAASAHEVRAADISRNEGRKEVAFVDTSVADYKALEAGVRDGVAIVEFDGSKDGLAQIAQWARDNSGYDAIHILSHGSEGALNLGSTVLSEASLSSPAVQAELADIGRALNADGDLLLYGCDTAAGAGGQQFVDDLARLTGADVAASNDASGAAAKGGDWTLEVRAGDIEARALAIADYQGLLDDIVFTDSDADYSSMTIQKTVNGRTVTFSGGTGFGGMGIDASYGAEGLYAYEGTSGGNDIKLTISIESGYMFDLQSLDAGVSSGSLSFALTYANGTTKSFTVNSLNDAWQTLSGFAEPTGHLTQVVLSSSDFGLFQHIEITNVRAIPLVPSVSDSNIAITSTPTGADGSYKIGDIVTATWANAAASEVDDVRMDFSAFGGGSSVAATFSSGVWSASYQIISGSIDATNRNVIVKAINAGGTTAVADSTNLSVDNRAPAVTDGNISISGGTGTGGAYKIGDTVTATWNNTAGGDNNSDTLSSVTFDFSAFGGSSSVLGNNSGGTWTATYTIAAGGLDAANRNVSVRVVDNAGNITTTADTTNATVDSIAPVVTDGNISISGGSGTGGAYKVGDTVTATWDNRGSGDNNSDTLASVAFDFSAFGGGSAVTANGSAGVWTATYTIVAGSIDGLANRNVALTVTDNAGNTTVLSDTTNATVDNQAPSATFNNIAFSSDTGTSGTDFITRTASQTITATLSGAPGAGNIVYGSLNNGATWTDITSNVSGTTLIWSGVTLSGSNTLKLKVADAAGNEAATASQAYTLDTSTPSAPSTPDMSSGTDTGASATDNNTSNTTPVFTGSAESGSTVTLYDTDGTTVLGTAVASGGAWSITSSTLGAGNHTLTAKATDTAGNVSSASSGLSVTIDTAAPTGLDLSATTINSLNAASSATIATLSASDSASVTYSLAAGNGTNDADNGSFAIAGNALAVGASSLTAGTYKIYVAATDVAGNVAYRAFTITVVDAPSVASIVRAGGASSTVNTSATSISYTVTFSESVSGVDASDFTVTPTGTADGTIASVTGSGTTYTVVVNALSGDGTLRLDLKNGGTGIRNGGNVDIDGGYTGGLTYTLDHTAPSAPSTPDMTGGTDTGTSSSDNITKSATPTFTGTAENGSTVTLYDTDGTTVLGTTTATGGTWSITSSTLSAGAHTLTAKATDAAGNVSSVSSGLSVTIDTTAPTLAITSNVSSLKIGETATITFTFSEDPGSTFTWDGSAGDIVVSGGTLGAISGSGLTRTAIFTPTASTNGGTASITVAAGSYTDAAGNNGGAGLAPSLTFDTLAPGAPSTPDMSSVSDSGVSSTDDITRDTTPTFTGTAASGSLVTLYDTDGTTVLGSAVAAGGTWSITASTLSEGAHTITAVATDAAGNNSSASSGLAVVIASTAPTTTVAGASLSADTGASGTDFVTRTGAQTISGILSAALASGEIVQVSLDNGSTWNSATASIGSNTWSYSTTLTGSDTLQVRVVDVAGNTGTAYAQAYTLDTTAPAVASVSVPASGAYGVGQDLDFTVHFSEPITVDTSGGSPRIALAIGGSTRYATYKSGSGSSDLVFGYTVAAGDQDADGITVGALNANGGTLQDVAGNDATLTLNSVGSTAAVNVDSTVPQITGIASSTADGSYKAGETVTIAVTFDHAVVVDTAGGTPALALNSGGTARYDSGSGGTTLIFTYTIGAGQNSADLDYSGSGALTLNGGSIKSADGAHGDASLALDANGALAAAKDIVVDTTPPVTPTLNAVDNATLTPTLSGTATLDAGESLTVAIGGATYNVVPSNGQWSLDLGTATPASGTLALEAGRSYTVTANAVDAAGNSSSASGSLVIAAPPPLTPAPVPTPSPTPAPAPAPAPSPLPPPPPLLTVVKPATVIDYGSGFAAPPIAAAQSVGTFLPPALEAVLKDSPVAAGTSFASALTGIALADSFSNPGRTSEMTLTRGGNFPVVVVRSNAGEERLQVNRGIADQIVPASGRAEIAIPADAFAHTDPNAAVQLVVRLADGRPLPSWMRFDSSTGKFVIEAPKGASGDFSVKVIARDKDGREAASTFHIRIGAGAPERPQAERTGRAGLSEQILHAARQRDAGSEGLAQLARVLRWPIG